MVETAGSGYSWNRVKDNTRISLYILSLSTHKRILEALILLLNTRYSVALA